VEAHIGYMLGPGTYSIEPRAWSLEIVASFTGLPLLNVHLL